MSIASPVVAPQRKSILAYSFGITIALFVIGVVLVTANADACTPTSYSLTSTAPTTNWSDTTKWTPSGYPGQCSGDTANIGLTGMTMNVDVALQPIQLAITTGCPVQIPSGGALTLETSSSATSSTSFTVNGGAFGVASGNSVTMQAPVTLNSGTLAIAGTMTMSNGAQVNVTGGTINGGGTLKIPASHFASFTGTNGAMTLDNVLFDNFGTVTFSSSANPLAINNSAGVTNESGATFTYSSSQPINTDNVGPPKIDNFGTFNITAGFSPTINVPLNNSGTIALLDTSATQTLTLAGGGAHGGTFSLNSPSIVAFNGSHTFNSGWTWSTLGNSTFELLGGTATVNGSFSTPNFTQTGGTLAGSGGVTVSNTFLWQGGTQTGSATTTLNGPGTISGTSVCTLDSGRTLAISGGSLVYNPGAGGGLAFTNASTLNMGGGSFDLQGDTTITADAASSIGVTGGTVKKTAGTRTLVGAALNIFGAGALQPGAGTTIALNNGGTISGSTISLDTSAAGSTIEFAGGTANLGNGVTITSGNFAITNSGILSVNVANSVGTLTQSGGVLTGSQTLTAGTLNWTGGTMSSTSGGGLSIVNTGNINGASATTLSGTWTLTNGGTVHYAPSASLAVNTGGKIANNGTWSLENGTAIASDLASSPLFNNAGTLTKMIAGTTAFGVPIGGAGAITLNGGADLELTGGGTLAGGTITFNNASDVLGIQTNAVTITTTPSVTGPGLVRVGSTGTLINSVITTIPNFELDNGGTSSGSGTLNVTSAFKSTGGFMSGGGTTSIASGATADLTSMSGSLTLNIYTLNNAGTMTWNPTFPLSFQGSGHFVNLATGILNITGPGGTSTGGTSNSFTNQGTINRSGAATYFTFDLPFTNSGTVSVTAANDILAFANGGSMTGGAMQGTVAGAGVDFTGGTFNVSGGTFGTAGGVKVDGGTLNLNANVSAPAAFALVSGTLGGSATLLLPSGSAGNVSGGTILNTTVTGASGSSLAFDTTSTSVTIDGSTINLNAGATGSWVGANQILIANGAAINDAGAFTWSGGGNIATLGATPAITVTGSLTKNSSTAATGVAANLQNSGGTISSQAGALQLNYSGSSNQSGTFDTNSGAEIDFGGNGGSNTFTNVTSSGTGLLRFLGGTTTFATNTTLLNLELDQATLNGASTILTFTGTFDWKGGTLNVATNNGGGTLNLLGTLGTMTLGANLSSGANFSSANNLSINSGITFTNPAGSTFTLSGNGAIAGSGTFTNTGTLARSVAGSNTISSGFNNAGGTVNLNAGTLTVSNGGTDSGTYNSAAGATLDFASGTRSMVSTATIGSGFNGALQITGGTVVDSGHFTPAGTVLINGGALAYNGSTAATLNQLTLAAGTLSGGGAVQVNGSSTWTGGTITGSGSFTINAGGALTVNGTTTPILDGRTITNDGTMTLASGTSFALEMDNGAAITNSTGTFDMQNDAGIMTAAGSASFNNLSTMTKSAGLLTQPFSPSLANGGAITLSSGTLSLLGTFSQSAGTTRLAGGALSSGSLLNFTGGTLTGSGTINAAVTNAGATIMPGTVAAPGTLTINGAFSQTSGTLQANLFANNSNGQISAPGNSASLGGNLHVVFQGGYTPANGDSFTVVNAGSFTDSSTKSYPSFGPNNTGFFTATPTSTALTLSATIPQSDVAISASAPATAVHFGNWNVTVPVTDNGPYGATNVVVTLTATNGTFNAVTSPSFTCSGTGPVTCTATSIASSATISVSLNATSLSGISLNASVTANESDPNTSNNSVTVSAGVQPAADLSIAIAGAPDPVNAGSNVVYTYTVTNNGPDTSTVAVNATIGAGTITSSNCGFFTTNNANCSAPSLAPSASTSFSITVKAPGAGPIVASGTVNTSGSAVDQNNANDAATTSTTVTPQADLKIVKSGASSVAPGANATYTITVTNLGPSDAAGVQVSDTPPAGMTFVSNSGACTTAFPCALGTLTAGQSAVINSTFALASNATGNVTNTATVSASTADPVPTNNSTSSTASATPSADLAITKSGPASAVPGAHITYDVTVTNNGPSDATGVVVADPLPSRLSFISATGACSGYPCNIGALPAGQSRSITATYLVLSGPPVTITNTASVSATTNDPLAGNNSASVSTTTGCPSGPPSNLLPAAGVTGVPTDGQLRWNAVGAASYNVYFGLAGSGCTTLYANTSATAVTYSALTPGTQYEWRVEAVTPGCSPVTSSCISFTTAAVCGGVAPPSLTGPPNGITIGSPVTFTWTPVAGASGYTVYAGINGATPAAVATTTDTHAIVPLDNGTVSWFVVANLGALCPPATSQSGSFTVCSSAAPPVPDVVTNAASGQVYTLQWDAITGAASYQVDEATNKDFTGAVTQSVNGTSINFQHSASNDALIFYYRLRSVSSCGGAVSGNSSVARVVITPIPKSAAPSVNVPDGSTTPVTQIVHVPGFPDGTFPFTASVDKPWMSVTPNSGFLPPAGIDLTITTDPTGLDNGTVTGTLLVSLIAPANAKVAPQASSTTVSVPVSVNIVTPVAPKPASPNGPVVNTLVIPSVGHLDGVNSQWQSDIRVTNASTARMKYQVSFTSAADPTNIQQTSISAAPGETVALNDVVKNWFGIGTTGETANGVLQIAPQSSGSGGVSVQTVASSRTYDVTTNGTLGQYIPAIPLSSFIGAAQQNQIASFLSLQQIEQSDRYRTNVGVVEAAGHPASVVVSAFDGNGAKLFDFPMDLKANEQRQLNGFLASQGVTSLTNGRIEVKVTGGGGKVTAYASLIDNKTGDPLLISGVPANTISANNYVLPGVADLNNGIANWRSDVRIYNAGTTPQVATLTFVPQNNSGAPATASVTVNPGEVKQLDAIVNTTFNLSNTGGALHVTTPAASSLVVTGRTYNQLSDGATYGQFIPAVTDGVGAGGPTLHILQVEDSVRYRTNIGVAEVSGKPATVELGVVLPDSKVTPTAVLTLGPNEYRQYDVIHSMGLANVYNARVTVRVIDGNGKVTAYGSVIDMTTQDPTFVPAQQ